MTKTRSSTRSSTLAGLLRERAEARGDDLAIRFKSGKAWHAWDWAGYWDAACVAARALAADGIRPGEHVLMLVPEIEPAVRALFGIWALGAVPVQVGLPYRLDDIAGFLDQLQRLAERLDARALVLSESLALFAIGREGRVPIVFTDALAAAGPGADGVPSLEPDAPDDAPGPALVQLTSGSTGAPNAVVIPHDRLLLHMESMSQALPSHEHSVAVSWLPLHHDMGLLGGLLFPFYNGFVANMMSPLDFRNRPLDWLAAMSRFRATICAAPTSAYGLATRLAQVAAREGLDLSAWECAMVGAEPVSERILARFSDAYRDLGFRDEAFFPVYGLAEATVAVTFPPLLAPRVVDTVDREVLERDGRAVVRDGPGTVALVGVGRAIPHTEVRIVDGSRAPVGERVVGAIEVRSETLMAGYYRDPEATEATIVDGWLRTGDLGYLADGVLFVTGRDKEIIIKGGHNLMPAVLEEVASAVAGVRAGCVAAVGVYDDERGTERVYLCAESKAGPAEYGVIATRVRDALAVHGMAVDEVVILKPGSLPKTTSGKLQRVLVARALAAGTLRAGGAASASAPAPASASTDDGAGSS